LAVQRCRAFTLIEIAIAVFILLLVVLLAVPSVNGVLADRRLRRSFDNMNDLVRQAQGEHEHRQNEFELPHRKVNFTDSLPCF